MSNDAMIRLKTGLERAAIYFEGQNGVLRPVRLEIGRIMRLVRRDVISTLSAGIPALGTRVEKAVKGKVYADLTGFRVRVANGRKGCVPTGRPSQALRPLPYWYEHGFRGPRMTRGRRIMGIVRTVKPHSTGGGHDGVHAIDRVNADTARYEGMLAEKLRTHTQTMLERIFYD